MARGAMGEAIRSGLDGRRARRGGGDGSHDRQTRVDHLGCAEADATTAKWAVWLGWARRGVARDGLDGWEGWRGEVGLHVRPGRCFRFPLG